MIQAAQNVNDVIDHLATKLAVPTAHLWAVLIRQQRIDVIECAIFLPLVALAVWGYVRLWKKYHDDDDYAIGFFIGGIALAIVMVIAVGWILTAVGEVANPEYYALKEVLSALKPDK